MWQTFYLTLNHIGQLVTNLTDGLFYVSDYTSRPTISLSRRLFIITFLTVLLSDRHSSASNTNIPETPLGKSNPHVEDVIDPDTLRPRTHIQEILQMEELQLTDPRHIKQTIEEAIKIYRHSIKPIQDVYNYHDLNRYILSEAELRAKPHVLFVGPWSTGKSTMINYLLGISEDTHALLTGAEPTTSDFTVVLHGKQPKGVDGLVLATDPQQPFSALEKFGKGFLEKFRGVEMSCDLLHHVSLVDTPGIIENRKQQERGYPFSEVMHWFLERAALVLVVFDPSKLDVGAELERLFGELKGHESKLRIVLNKADTLSSQELMRVYGALFWNLAPLINVTEPPRVFVGSFWDRAYRRHSDVNAALFQHEEVSLLTDIQGTITNAVEDKISSLRQHASQVRIHALAVDQYLRAYNQENGFFKDSELLLHDVVDNPDRYKIFSSLQAYEYVSKYDLPTPEQYAEFFSVHALNTFRTLDSQCSMFGSCPLDTLTDSIAWELPRLLTDFQNGKCERDVCAKQP